MKKAVYVLIVLNLIGLAIIMATNDFNFGQKQNNQSFYPPSVDFKQATEQAMNEILPNKIFDLIWDISFYWNTIFESLDGFALGGNVPTIDPVNFGGVNLTTTAVANNSSYLYKIIGDGQQSPVVFNKKTRIKYHIDTSVLTNITAFFTLGTYGIGEEYYGFEIVNGVLKGSSSNADTGSSNAITLMTLSASTTYILEAKYNPNDKIVFIVNGIEVGIIKNELPTPDNMGLGFLCNAQVKTTDTVAKTINLKRFFILQEK